MFYTTPFISIKNIYYIIDSDLSLCYNKKENPVEKFLRMTVIVQPVCYNIIKDYLM